VLLDVGDGHEVYWERHGDPGGKPAVVLHGGPGSGAVPWWRTLFDPAAYHAVLFDQRGCGRSRPHAGAPTADLSANTTHHLIADIERLREHLGIERWLVLGGSWGSTLALAYAETHPDRVTEMVLFSAGTGARREIEWFTRGIRDQFPEAWARFRDGVPEPDRDGSLVDAYSALLHDPDPAVHDKAARDWCDWEANYLGAGDRYDDPRFRLCFARLVTHYWRHAAWLEDGALIAGLDRLRDSPGVVIQGGRDVGAPLRVASAITERWGELVVLDDEPHSAGPAMETEIRRALARFR
jgi:proline iminopeptidase